MAEENDTQKSDSEAVDQQQAGSAFRRIGWIEAEGHLGGRVDRRKAYYYCDDAQMMDYLCGGPVFEYGEWTESCTGCRETEDGQNVGDYPWDSKAGCYIGAGCDECGYTGKRRSGLHVPAKILQNDQEQRTAKN